MTHNIHMMRCITFDPTNPVHTNTVLDACQSQTGNFDDVQIMRYIAENDQNGQTFDHHDLAFHLDYLERKGIIKRANERGFDGHTRYIYRQAA